MLPFDKKRRKKLLINPPFQHRILRDSLMISTAIGLVYLGASRYFFHGLTERGHALSLPDGHIFFRFVEQQQRQMTWIFIITSVVSAVFITAHGLYLSNKIAGPIHRIKTFLKERKEGKVSSSLQFRGNDFFQDLATAVNEYVDHESHESRNSQSAGD